MELSIRRVGGQASGASAHGAAGVGERGPAAAQDTVVRGAGAGSVKPVIDAMLRSDLDAPKKQRHTARRVLARLVDEHGAAAICRIRRCVTTSPSAVRRSPPRRVRPLEEGFVPQTHPPAAEAEVDFHDLWVILRGMKTKTALFTMRLSYSGRAAHRASLSQGQEAFLESHVYAFDRLGGVPIEQIRYDNLNRAVSRVLFGRTRIEIRALDRVPLALRFRRRSTAARAMRAATRRAGWRARAAGSAVTTVSRCVD